MVVEKRYATRSKQFGLGTRWPGSLCLAALAAEHQSADTQYGHLSPSLGILLGDDRQPPTSDGQPVSESGPRVHWPSYSIGEQAMRSSSGDYHNSASITRFVPGACN